MNQNIKLKPQQISHCHELIGKIDCGRQNIFLSTVNTENQIDVHVFENGAGVYFSSHYEGRVRIHICFQKDTDKFNDEIIKLVQSTSRKVDEADVMIFVYKHNTKIIAHIIDYYKIPPQYDRFHYSAIEFVMRRENFSKVYINTNLDIRPYEEIHIDVYLEMLDESMDFGGGTPNFREAKEYLMEDFAAYAKTNSFEALWLNDELAGLYWRNGAEIDMMAVSVKHQGKGYGSDLLTRALETSFAATDADFAFLYAVDWNTKGQAFYKKYGMEVLGQPCIVMLPKQSQEM